MSAVPPNAEVKSEVDGLLDQVIWVTGESTKETVKTIVQGDPKRDAGNAGCPGEPVVTSVRLLPLHAGCGCSGHPAFPCVHFLKWTNEFAKLGRSVPRE